MMLVWRGLTSLATMVSCTSDTSFVLALYSHRSLGCRATYWAHDIVVTLNQRQ